MQQMSERKKEISQCRKNHLTESVKADPPPPSPSLFPPTLPAHCLVYILFCFSYQKFVSIIGFNCHERLCGGDVISENSTFKDLLHDQQIKSLIYMRGIQWTKLLSFLYSLFSNCLWMLYFNGGSIGNNFSIL